MKRNTLHIMLQEAEKFDISEYSILDKNAEYTKAGSFPWGLFM